MLIIEVDGVDHSDLIRLESVAIVEMAFGGEVGIGGFNRDDDALGDVPAMKFTTIDESAATPDRMFTGYTSVRSLDRGPFSQSTDRQWDVTILDLNTLLDDEVFQVSSANRPAETDYQRVTWLLTTPALLEALGVTAGVLPNTNTVTLEAQNYKGESPRRVLEDCGRASNKNFFLYNYGSGNKLYYDLAAGTSLTSSLTLSSVRADIDNSTCFVVTDPALALDATGIYSAVDFRYEGGHVYVKDTAIEAAYRRREITIRDSSVKTAAKATERSEAFLEATAIEKRTFKTSVLLPAANVNDIRAGQRIQVKVPHLGISSFTYMRITRRELIPQPSDQYLLALEFAENVLPVNNPGSGNGGVDPGGGGDGGGSSPWVPFLDEDGASLANWTTLLGDWSVSGDEIVGEVDVENTAILYYNDRAPIAGIVFEAEVRGDEWFGVLVDLYPDSGAPSFSQGHLIWLAVGSPLIHFWDIPYQPTGSQQQSVNDWADPGTIADDVYYKVRVMRIGMWMNVWVDDELYSTFTPGEPYGVPIVYDLSIGTVDSANTTFTVNQPYKPSTTNVYLNGQKLRRTVDYNEDADHVTIEMTDAPTTGDTLWVEYRAISVAMLDFVGLWVRGVPGDTANFRNIKAWRLALP